MNVGILAKLEGAKGGLFNGRSHLFHHLVRMMRQCCLLPMQRNVFAHEIKISAVTHRVGSFDKFFC